MNSIHPLGLSGLIQPSPFKEVIYEFKPNLNTYFKKTKFVTNSNGLRDKEYSLGKGSSAFRVAVIGDSFSVPAGVNIESAYHSLLEERLNQASKEIKYEFINFSVGGYNFRQYLAVIENKAMKYNPDIILIGFCPNDVFELPESHFKNKYKVKKEANPFFHAHSLDLIGQRFQVLMERMGVLFKRRSTEEENERMPVDIEYMKNMISKLAVIRNHFKIPIIIAYLDIGRSNETPIRLLTNLTDRYGLYFIDLSTFFDSITPSAFYIYRADRHPNAKAHIIFANGLYDFLEKKSLISPIKIGAILNEADGTKAGRENTVIGAKPSV
jgi:lysophospholipase L1-like esterase